VTPSEGDVRWWCCRRCSDLERGGRGFWLGKGNTPVVECRAAAPLPLRMRRESHMRKQADVEGNVAWAGDWVGGAVRSKKPNLLLFLNKCNFV
jgi:hypothetical protein